MIIICIPDHKAVGWNFYIHKTGHWARRGEVSNTIHQLVMAYVNSQKIKPIDYRVNITITAHSNKPLDPDNIAAKLYIDGLVLSGILKDDSRKYIGRVTLESLKVKPKQGEFVEITIEKSENQNPD